MGCCPFFPYQEVKEYSLYKSQFHRNWNGTPYCLWCQVNIRNESLFLLKCVDCNYIIGHKECLKPGHCPKCYQM